MKLFFLSFFITAASSVFAQKVDSIYFHLYTDSLKKGVHNYINVDGKCNNGQWLPLTQKEIQFSSNAGRFEGNNLILDTGFAEKSVKVKAVLKENPNIQREITIYLKTGPDTEKVKTMEEVMRKKS
jgi:hypothetical protein